MTRTRMLAAIGVAALVLLAGCGGTGGDGAATTTTTAGMNETTEMTETTTTAGMNETTTTAGMNETTEMTETTTTAGMNETTEMTETTTTAGMNETTTTAAGNDSAANVTFENQTSNGSMVTVASVSLSDGGFVVIHRSDDGQAGEVIGNSTYLESGVTEDVTVTLDATVSDETELVAMAHRDTNDNQMYEFPDADGPYTMNGSAVVDVATITVEENATTTTAEN